MSKTFESWTKKELIKFLEGTMENNNKLKVWLYQNHIKVLRQYEDEHLGGLHLQLLNSEKEHFTKEEK